MKQICLCICILSCLFLSIECSKNKNQIIETVVKNQDNLNKVEHTIFFDQNNVYNLLINEPGNIISLQYKYIKYLDKEIIEIVKSSNMGNGYIHIFDYDQNELLNEYFYDSHSDELEYSELNKYKYFSDKKGVLECKYVNIYFRNNYSLNIEYNENNIRIYGFRDYILFNNNGIEEILLSQEINNYYYFDFDINKFVLNKNISTGSYFEWWNYLNK